MPDHFCMNSDIIYTFSDILEMGSTNATHIIDPHMVLSDSVNTDMSTTYEHGPLMGKPLHVITLVQYCVCMPDVQLACLLAAGNSDERTSQYFVHHNFTTYNI